jgi:hypothetical protein
MRQIELYAYVPIGQRLNEHTYKSGLGRIQLQISIVLYFVMRVKVRFCKNAYTLKWFI